MTTHEQRRHEDALRALRQAWAHLQDAADDLRPVAGDALEVVIAARWKAKEAMRLIESRLSPQPAKWTEVAS
jgi:hypothetical protein